MVRTPFLHWDIRTYVCLPLRKTRMLLLQDYSRRGNRGNILCCINRKGEIEEFYGLFMSIPNSHVVTQILGMMVFGDGASGR